MSTIYNPNISPTATISKVSAPSDFASSTISTVAQTKQNKIMADLLKVKANYLAGLANSHIDISTTENILLNLTKIIHYSVTFVETNGLTISKMLITDFTSEFKLSTCVNFVMDIIGSLVPHNHIVAYIEHFVSLLYGHNDSPKTPTPSVLDMSSTPVKKTGTLKRSARYILQKSGCISASN